MKLKKSLIWVKHEIIYEIMTNPFKVIFDGVQLKSRYFYTNTNYLKKFSSADKFQSIFPKFL